ncbi:hypothetical protein NM688_g3697 [Phlebia brevispora]|uniref:Uncharacterized protein n=1 Tax=Phlebia brevispora TaxID=194682 RepID=A0ACC1T509_9APHY|nr:hypothetical protein NM688_g3697 [Phlebia brevispora]
MSSLKRPLCEEETSTSEPKRLRTEAATPMSAIVRILSWNIETPIPFLSLSAKAIGSSKASHPLRPKHLREMLARHEFPDFLCLQEVRARQSDTEWITALKGAVNGRDSGPKYAVYTSLNRATRGQRHFGTATFAKNPDAVAVAREVDWDSEGRVVILEMRAGWALVNVYALNGSEYPRRDPTGKSLPKTRNERKREFNRLLLRECQAMQARGLHVVLIGDFNISLTKADCYPRLRTEYPHALARKEFNEKFIPEAKVADVFRHIHGDKRSFSWFAKGKPQGEDCARVDYALVERAIVDRVVHMEYLEDPKERAHSDHAPLLLELKDMNFAGPTSSGTT